MEEIKTILSIDVGKAPKNIKELKQQIKDLQDALVRTDDTTDEYKTTLNSLVASQQKLQSILKATKSDVSAAEGSYNALNATMKSLQQQWKATGDEAERNKLGKAILDINNQLKDLDSSIGNNQRKVGSYTEGIVDAFAQLKSEIKQYKNELLTLEEGTQEYNDTLAKLGNAQFQMKDMTEKAKYSVDDLGEKLNTISKVGQGVVGGFNALQGVFALCGTEGENLQKIMVKLQAGMAIVQGLQGMEGMIDSINGLKIQFGGAIKSVKLFIKSLSGVKGAIAATGIGIFLVLLGTLIANWDKVTAAIDRFINKETDAERAVKNLTKAQEYLNRELERSTRLHNQQNDLLLAAGATGKEIAERDLAYADEKYERQLKLANAANKQLKHLKYQKENVFMSGISDEDIEKAQKNYDDAKALQDKYFQELLDARHNVEVEGVKEKKAAEDEKKRIAQQIAEEQKRAAQQAAEERKRIRLEEKKRVSEIRRETQLELMTEEEKELSILKEEYEEKKKLLEKYKQDTTELTTLYDKEKKDIEKKYADERVKIAEEEARKKLEAERKALESKITSATNTANYNQDIATASAESTYLSTISQKTGGKNNKPISETEQIDAQIEYNNQLMQIEQERFNRQQELWQLELDSSATSAERKLEIEREMSIAKIELANKVAQNNLTNDELERQSIEITKKKREQATMATLSVTSTSLKAVGGLFEENSKEAKGFAVAAATIDTFAAAIAAYKSAAEIPYVGFVLGPIAAAAAVTAGAAQVKNILSTDEKTGAGGSLSTSIPATTNPIINQNDLAVGYTRNLLGNSEEEKLNSDTRVYILESDIEESGQRVQVRENNTNF